jgi:hypothetical protein
MAMYASDAVAASAVIEPAAQVIEHLCSKAEHQLSRR